MAALLKRIRVKANRGQTLLEYFMILAVLILPLALTVRDAFLADSAPDGRGKSNDNVMRNIVSDSYGNETRFGIIGRPYP